jgi:hypothetical protein
MRIISPEIFRNIFMTDSEPTARSSDSSSNATPATPLRCLIGSTLSGALGIGLYSLTVAIANNFASKPLVSQKAIVLRLSSLVRTLVLGVASLGTFIFFFVAFGLILLALQLALKELRQKAIAHKKEN